MSEKWKIILWELPCTALKLEGKVLKLRNLNPNELSLIKQIFGYCNLAYKGYKKQCATSPVFSSYIYHLHNCSLYSIYIFAFTILAS